jgi:hypothetical protein
VFDAHSNQTVPECGSIVVHKGRPVDICLQMSDEVSTLVLVVAPARFLSRVTPRQESPLPTPGNQRPGTAQGYTERT